MCRFINCNKRIPLVGDTDNGETMYVWGPGVYGKSVPSQFFLKLKNALKNQVHLKKKMLQIQKNKNQISLI